jgi:(E)-2-((N-methylformamido)methylene)succinate hydrolase
MPLIRLPHSETFYVEEGNGTPLVLIHGMGGDHTVWDWQVPVLRDRFRIIRPDNLGHGLSEKPAGPWTFAQFSRQIAELLDHLSVPRAVVAGFSLGGSIGQAVALDYPDRVAALIVVSSACARTAGEQEAVERRVAQVAGGGPPAVVDGALKRWFTDKFASENPALIEHWRKMLLDNDPAPYLAVYRLYAEVDRQLLHRVGDIRAPTLVITGDKDPGQTTRMANELSRRIPGSELRIFPGIPHMLPFEAAAELNEAIADFAARRSAAL